MTLREAGVVLLDCVHATPAAVPDGYPYIAIPQMKNGRIDFTEARRISQADFKEWTKKARPQRHDVVLSRRTNPGVTATFGESCDFALGQNLVLLRANGKHVFAPFLRWLVSSPAWWQQIEKYNNVGAIFDSLKCADVPRFELPIPPVKHQEWIASVLGALDDKIDLNRRMKETLEAMAWAIFKDWFINFGPTRAKMEGGAPYLAPEIWALFPDRLDDAGNPEGWETRPLLDLCQLKRGYDLPTNQRVHGRFPIVSSSGFSGYHMTAMAGAPGVVTGRYGTIGKVFFIDTEFWPLNTALYVKDFKGNSPRFVFHTLRDLDFQRFSDKGAVPGVNRNDLHRAPIVLPSNCIQDAFEALLSPMWQRAAANENEAITLAHMRDLLLPKLMSGELCMRDAERVVEAAL